MVLAKQAYFNMILSSLPYKNMLLFQLLLDMIHHFDKINCHMVKLEEKKPTTLKSSCSVDVNGNATCTCDGNWNGTYCQGMLFTRQIINSSHGFSKTSIF
jgi:hypothetical protein